MTASSAPPTVERLLAERAWIVSLARSLVVDPASADDVAQDATVVALGRGPSEPAAYRGWIGRVVRNLSSNARREAARRRAREERVARPESAGADGPAELAARWEIRKQVVEAVLALDEPYRATILLRYFEGLPSG